MSPRKRVGLLVAIAFLGWLVLVGPAVWIAGWKGVEGLTWAALVCLLPGLPVVWCVSRVPTSPARIWMVVGGAAVRMIVVIGAMVVMSQLRPDLRFAQFHCWLGLFYNILLFAEMFLTMSDEGQSRTTR